ncbi:MAG TPA: helicase C-terminal domain-containing protein [Gemmatimonadaceae bacterium]
MAEGCLFTSAAAGAVRAAIRLAGGREVCFVCTMDGDGNVATARVVARGDVTSVLALPGFAKAGELLLHNHPSGGLDPSEPDLQVAARMHDLGVGFAITNNDASELYVVVEVPKPQVLVPLDLGAIDADLGPDGAVAKHHGAYESRQGQRDYARGVARLYNLGGIGVLEAGTGIGKSLGYLIPALRWSATNKERTVVSTNTINLQEQLVGKDLPFLADALGDQPVRYALLKGWRNYLCLNRLDQAAGAHATLFPGEGEEKLADLIEWAGKTKDGSLSDLPVQPGDEIWDEVAAEPDLCQRLKCQFFDKCFLFAARRKAAQADVIVVNHHLLLSDIAVRRITQNWDDAAVLPPYTRLILDEGHHLEDAAGAHLGQTITRRGLERLFARLERRGKGLLPTLVSRLIGRRDLVSVASLDLVQARLTGSTRAGREKGGTVFDLLDMMMTSESAMVRRVDKDFETHEIWRGGLEAALPDLLSEIEILAKGLQLVRDRMEDDDAALERYGTLLGEVRAVTRRLQNAGDALRAALQPPDDALPAVRWVEVRGKERNIAVSSVPLDLAPILREDLFRKVETCVVTSATLAVDGRFGFLRTRLGLDEDDVEPSCAIHPSPFDFSTQAVLAIPNDGPAPNVNAAGHLDTVCRVLADLIDITRGGVFGLFTSHRDVRAAAVALREVGVGKRYTLLVHGEDSRQSLLRRFIETGSGVLLGTASFWEGVDVPGDPLRALLLAKLPFRVPTEPLVAARCERVERGGGDAFNDYMLPDAALRLKQGFGRLIRSSTDRGAVVLMDPRVLSRGYGEMLLDTLPPAKRVIGPWEDVRRQLVPFFGSGAAPAPSKPKRPKAASKAAE